MKRVITIFSILIAIHHDGFSQVSLKSYCPTTTAQDGATCASYAPTTYTAMSIMYNYRDGYTEGMPNFYVFSEGFVASRIKRMKSFFGRAFNKCGRNVVVTDALNTLANPGTVLKRYFPEKCDCGKQKTTEVGNTFTLYKISSWKVIGTDTSNTAAHISDIIKCLDNFKPVVIAINQDDQFRSNSSATFSFPASYKTTTTPTM